MQKVRNLKSLFFFYLFLVLILIWFQQKGLIGETKPRRYEYLQPYTKQGEDFPIYQQTQTSSFTEINSYKNVVAWSDYDYDIPFIIINNTLVMAGYLTDNSEDTPMRASVTVLNVDIETGKIQWQTASGNNLIATDGSKIFISTENEPFQSSGISAHDIATGAMKWQTFFNLEDAVGNSFFAITPHGLSIETYHRSETALYVLDPNTGNIESHVRNTLIPEKQSELNELIFEKQNNIDEGTLKVIHKDDGATAWMFEKPIVSNIAVGGDITYFFTKDRKLFAVDTQTGEILDSVEFEPHFSDNYDFANNSIIVAAEDHTISLYFEDARQLSIFRYQP